MIKDNLHSGKETRDKLFAGIKKVSIAVGATMGSSGTNGLIETVESPGHRLTNDGITLVESIVLADPIEDMGRKILLEAISRANKQSGDGSSTTCVLTSAILEEGMKSDTPPMQLKAELEACVPLIEESINKQKRMITVDEVGQVATVAAESKEIGAMIQDIYKQIGKDGIIHWDISKTFDDYYTIGKGITVDGAGFTSPYFADINEATGQFTSELRWKNPKILIIKQRIGSATDFNELFQKMDGQGDKEVVIFCDDYEPTVIPALVQTKIQRGFKTVLIKMPVLWKDWWYTDLAAATGATVIDGIGLSLKNVNESHLGTCENIIVDKENTYIDGIRDMGNYIATLEEEGNDDSKLRSSRLNTKTARYFVGAMSESALSHRRYKVEDAINSAYQALQNGIVIGGGVSLVCVAQQLIHPILNVALCSPYKQIEKNMGKTFTTQDMEDQGVYDATNVVINSMRNAISVAASILTASVVIVYPRPDIADQLVERIMNKRP